MIIKDEEQYLEKCLKKALDYVDEIVIVDTGSTDKSKTIAKGYTDKIYDFEWCNDFSKARNFSLSKATHDWVLILDADEMVLEFNEIKIEEFIKSHNKEKIVGRIKITNLFEDNNEIKKSTVYVSRLFNRKSFYYEGPIHEQIMAKDKSKYIVKNTAIVVEHLGYLDEIMNKKDKYARNITLLKGALKDNKRDPYYHYQLGKSYYKAQQYKIADESFKKAISLCKNFKYEYAQDLVESHGYALLKCGKYVEAMELKGYQKEYDHSPDYNFIMGLIYMNNGKFQKAIDSFQKCIGKHEGKVEGINSYQPNYNIGVIYQTLGHTQEAITFYKKCGNYSPALERLRSLLKEDIKRFINDNQLEKAKNILENNKNILENDIETCAIGAVIAMMYGEMNRAEEILLEGLKLDGKDFNLLYNLAYVYQNTNNIEKAVTYYKKALENTNNEKNKNEVYGILKFLR